MTTPLHLWRNFGADRDSHRRFPLIISLLAFLFSMFTMGLLGQGRQPRSPQTAAAAVPAASSVGIRHDLSASLADLERVSQAADNDIAGLQVDKWGAGWTKSILRSKDQHQQQAQQVAASLQRNLRGAMPGLIHDVQIAHGNLSSTFKLYDNLSVVCEALDSLLTTAESRGKKEELAPLNEDYNALIRLRREFSSYIQTAAVSMETKGRMPAYTATSTGSKSGSGSHVITGSDGVKRIVVDDTIPEKKQKSVQPAKPATKSAAAPAAAPVARAAAPAPAPAKASAPALAASSAPAPQTAPAPRPAPAPEAQPTPKKKATVYYTNNY
jgi:hypothetical protein